MVPLWDRAEPDAVRCQQQLAFSRSEARAGSGA
jgi:hypothetical protein